MCRCRAGSSAGDHSSRKFRHSRSGRSSGPRSATSRGRTGGSSRRRPSRRRMRRRTPRHSCRVRTHGLRTSADRRPCTARRKSSSLPVRRRRTSRRNHPGHRPGPHRWACTVRTTSRRRSLPRTDRHPRSSLRPRSPRSSPRSCRRRTVAPCKGTSNAKRSGPRGGTPGPPGSLRSSPRQPSGPQSRPSQRGVQLAGQRPPVQGSPPGQSASEVQSVRQQRKPCSPSATVAAPTASIVRGRREAALTSSGLPV